MSEDRWDSSILYQVLKVSCLKKKMVALYCMKLTIYGISLLIQVTSIQSSDFEGDVGMVGTV